MPRLALTAVLLFASGATAAPVPVPAAAAKPDPEELKAVVRKGYDAVKAGLNADGSYGYAAAVPVNITSATVVALLRHGYAPDDPVVARMLGYLEKCAQPDGSVHYVGFRFTTGPAVVAFRAAGRPDRYNGRIAAGGKFLRTMQGADPANPLEFGGAGADVRLAGDVPGTHAVVQGLLASGAAADDPAVGNAVRFLSRCQNLPGEFSDLPYAKQATDDDKGGFARRPAPDPFLDPAGKRPTDAGATHAAIKSLLDSGVKKDDPRLKAALDWVARHYTLTEVPTKARVGPGLFEYRQLLAESMAALGDDVFADAKGVKHPWRVELFDTLKAAQQPDGTWADKKDKTLERYPGIATAYALLTLSRCK